MSDNGRRNVLKRIGQISTAGLLPTAGIGKVAADPITTCSGVDTDFDPSSKNELRQFFTDLGRLSEEERIEAQKQLDESRSEAVIKVLESFEIEIDFDDPQTSSSQEFSTEQNNLLDPGGGGGSTWLETTITGTERARWQYIGYTLWIFEYEVAWEYDQSGIRNVRERPGHDIRDSTWSHDGEVSAGCWMEEGSSSFESRREHAFTYIGGGSIPTMTLNPWVRLTGDESGNGEVLDSGGGGDIYG